MPDKLKESKSLEKRYASNETTLVSRIPNIINEENAITPSGKEKIAVSILIVEFCPKQALPYFLLAGKIDNNGCRYI